MVTMPLLERYLRQKVELPLRGSLNETFYKELTGLFPELRDVGTAKKFWHVYRNGLLHEVAMSSQNGTSSPMLVGSLSHDIPNIAIDLDGGFWLHPCDFAKRVVQAIENDFASYERDSLVERLPTVKTLTPGFGSGTNPIALGTNTDRD